MSSLSTLVFPRMQPTDSKFEEQEELMRSTNPRFPVEIFERIIDMVEELSKGPIFPDELDPRDLVQCSLVCRSWVPRTRLHIFRSVKLRRMSKAYWFLDILAHKPAYGQFVKTLFIWPDPDISMDEATELPEMQTSIPTKSQTWWIHEALIRLPKLLSNLQTLYLAGLPVLHLAFVILCSQFTTVQTLHLWNLDNQSGPEIVQLISRFSQIHTLTMGIMWRYPVSYYKGKRHNLKDLYVSIVDQMSPQGVSDLLKRLVTCGSISMLTNLTLNIDVSPTILVDLLLHSCSHTLCELCLVLHDLTNLDKWCKYSLKSVI